MKLCWKCLWHNVSAQKIISTLSDMMGISGVALRAEACVFCSISSPDRLTDHKYSIYFGGTIELHQ